MVIVVMVTRLYPECAPAKREFVDITGKADINQANLMITIPMKHPANTAGCLMC